MASGRASFLEKFFKNIGQENLIQRFFSQGYETIFDMVLITDEDLEHNLLVGDGGVRQLIISAVHKVDVREWLEFCGLQKYAKNLKLCGLKTVGAMKALNGKVSDELLESIEMTLPSHCKRLKAAVELLNWQPDELSEGEISAGSEEDRGSTLEPTAASLVVEGYWSRPEYVAESNSEFLCVKGILKARCGPTEEESEELEFIVDSASEVVTARLETIQQLNLAYKHNILSHGIHAVEERHLYAGVLRLGSREITVEVIQDTYQSVGTNVMRHFSHFINHEKHCWYSCAQHDQVTNANDCKNEELCFGVKS